MAAIKTNFISGRELKIGNVYIPDGETAVFAKVTDMSVSKPGKHGSAKTILSARNIINGKSIACTFKDSDNKIHCVVDFCYNHRVVYNATDSEMCVNLETGETIAYTYFINNDDNAVKKAIAAEKVKLNENWVNEKGQVLLIKYSEIDETKTKLIFWECVYSAPEDLSRYGITDYIS
ncbi:hypothetical protein PAPHI01_1723 [Pancytospora philotis]|nr:hypothetical protein PAPHI01_1723 [Pancytospora philotis]